MSAGSSTLPPIEMLAPPTTAPSGGASERNEGGTVSIEKLADNCGDTRPNPSVAVALIETGPSGSLAAGW